MENVVLQLLAIAVSVGNMFLRACILLDMWRWFLVPLGLPTVSYWHIWGICAFVGLTVVNSEHIRAIALRENDGLEDQFKIEFSKTFAFLLCWGISALVHIGMP